MQTISKCEPFVWDNPDAWDEDWAKEWHKIEKLFEKIDEIKQVFNDIEVPYLYRISQKQVMINLEKYAYSLSKLIANKYK